MSKIANFFDSAFSHDTKIETQSSLLVLYHLNQLQLKVKPTKYKKNTIPFRIQFEINDKGHVISQTCNVSWYFSIGSGSMGNSKWQIPEEHSQIRKKTEEL